MATTESRPAALRGRRRDRLRRPLLRRHHRARARRCSGTVRDGGHIVANTAPGCWGPMITPAIKGGHEVTLPVDVEGAEVGDAIAIRIRYDRRHVARDVVGQRPHHRGALQRRSVLRQGVPAAAAPRTRPTVRRGHRRGRGALRDVRRAAAPFAFTNGYTIAFDDDRRLGVTVGREQAEAFARDAAHAAALPAALDPEPDPDSSRRTTSSASSRGCGPFMGQLGTMPAIDLPDSHNAGDFGAFLRRRAAPPRGDRRAARARAPTATWTSTPSARARSSSARSRCPAAASTSATCTRCRATARSPATRPTSPGTVTLQVLGASRASDIDGPVLFPVAEDLPFLARPLTAAERTQAEALAAALRRRRSRSSLPISFVGTGPDLNSRGRERPARAPRRVLGDGGAGGDEPRDDQRRDRDRPRARASCR